MLEHSRKMILVPEEEYSKLTSGKHIENFEEQKLQYGGNIEKPNEGNIMETKVKKKPELDKSRKFLYIALQIAMTQGYNNDFNIVDLNGYAIDGSDILNLINHSLTNEKLI